MKPDFRKAARRKARALHNKGYVIAAGAVDLAVYAAEQQHKYGFGRDLQLAAMSRMLQHHSWVVQR